MSSRQPEQPWMCACLEGKHRRRILTMNEPQSRPKNGETRAESYARGSTQSICLRPKRCGIEQFNLKSSVYITGSSDEEVQRRSQRAISPPTFYHQPIYIYPDYLCFERQPQSKARMICKSKFSWYHRVSLMEIS